MGFSTKQLRALKRGPGHNNTRIREAHGRTFLYLEGWFTISEANRIFGFDGWNRETLESRCVFARENRGSFLAVYIAKVRVTVTADGTTLIREGHGTGEARGDSLGEVHDIALKAAETDATKRAFITFGAPFGLELYRHSKSSSGLQTSAITNAGELSAKDTATHPDDTTPIPRPSRCYGRDTDEITDHFRKERQDAANSVSSPEKPSSSVAPENVPLIPPQSQKIDKSQLTIGEPKRLRDKAHLRFVASKPCLICGRQPSDPHHLRFAQPRAIGLKVSDEFTVPLCRTHHRQLHHVGDERQWWKSYSISPLETAQTLWIETRKGATEEKSSRSEQ
jgi:hypothetical protein